MADDDIQKWRSEQALRQGEARLAAQNAALTAIEARAMSVVGWATTIAVASTAAALRDMDSGRVHWFALGLAAVMAAAALSAAVALFPRAGWGMPGHRPADVLKAHGESIAEASAWLAEGYGEAIADNAARLDRSGAWLRVGLRLMLIGGCAAVAVAAYIARGLGRG